MPDLTTITAAITSVKNATDIVKAMRAVEAAYQNLEVKAKLVDLMNNLVDLKMQLAEIREEGLAKDEEIRKLRAERDEKKALVWESPLYWMEKEGMRTGPFCPQCYDSSAKVVRLQETSHPDYWHCRTCNNGFQVGDQKKPQASRPVKTDYF